MLYSRTKDYAFYNYFFSRSDKRMCTFCEFKRKLLCFIHGQRIMLSTIFFSRSNFVHFVSSKESCYALLTDKGLCFQLFFFSRSDNWICTFCEFKRKLLCFIHGQRIMLSITIFFQDQNPILLAQTLSMEYLCLLPIRHCENSAIPPTKVVMARFR